MPRGVTRLGLIRQGFVSLLLVAALVLASCGQSTAPAPAKPAAAQPQPATAAAPAAPAKAPAQAEAKAPAAAPAPAKAWQPTEKITLLIPSTPGAGTDLLVRSMAKQMQKNVSVPVTMTNMPGAGGVAAAETVLRSPATNYTVSSAFFPGWAFTEAIGRLPFAIMDFSWISRVRVAPWVMTVSAKSPYKSIGDLQNAGKTIRIGAHGWGEGTPEVAASFAEVLKIPYRIVTYQGTAEIFAALVRGDVDAFLISVTPTLQWIEKGDVRALAYTGDKRDTRMPNVPTLRELGLKDVADVMDLMHFTVVFMMDKRVSPDVIAFHSNLIKKTLDDPEFVKWAEESKVIFDTKDAYLGAKETTDLVTKSLALGKRFAHVVPK